MTKRLTLVRVARTYTATPRLFFAWILHMPTCGPKCGALTSPQFLHRNQTPRCIWRWGLWEVIRFRGSHERAGLHDRINVVIRRHWLPRWFGGKEPTCQCSWCERRGFDPWVRKIPWRRKWQPSPVFLPGKSHRQRSLMGYSPWDHYRVRHDLTTKHSKKRHQRVCSLLLSPCHVSIPWDVCACQVASVMSNSYQPYGP